MKLETLIEEGVRLSKPCLQLTSYGAGSEAQGIWGGTVDTLEGKDWKHWVSVSGTVLQSLGFEIQGCLSVYENEQGWMAVVNPSDHLLNSSSGIPLYSTPTISFPPLDAICLYGNSEIEEWLTSQGLSRSDADAVYVTELGDAYNREFQARSPFYRQEADLVIGGWHIIWAEDDAYDENKGKLLLWTFRDAEPWLEVWLTDGQLQVKDRIT